MSRRFLLQTSIVTALFALSASAFSAAVVDSGKLFSPPASASGKVIAKRDLDRLFVATRGDVISAPVSITSHRAGSRRTLLGESFDGADATPSTALPECADLTAAMASLATPDLSPAPAPENIGSASSFAAAAAVPEPTSVALLAMGAFAFLRRRRA